MVRVRVVFDYHAEMSFAVLCRLENPKRYSRLGADGDHLTWDSSSSIKPHPETTLQPSKA